MKRTSTITRATWRQRLWCALHSVGTATGTDTLHCAEATGYHSIAVTYTESTSCGRRSLASAVITNETQP